MISDHGITGSQQPKAPNPLATMLRHADMQRQAVVTYSSQSTTGTFRKGWLADVIRGSQAPHLASCKPGPPPPHHPQDQPHSHPRAPLHVSLSGTHTLARICLLRASDSLDSMVPLALASARAVFCSLLCAAGSLKRWLISDELQLLDANTCNATARRRASGGFTLHYISHHIVHV